MDKKVMYGLGAVALIGAILYFRNKSSVAPAEEVAEEPAEEGAGGGGAGGGGGAPAPSPSDMAMGEVAKEELRKSMDLGGLDMASTKAEKGAVVTGMVASMVSKGKDVSPVLAKAMLKSPLPTPTKDRIVGRIINSKDAPNRGVLTNVPTSIPKAGVKPTIFNQGRATTVSTPPKPTLGKTISNVVAKSPSAQVQKAVAKAVARPVVQVSKPVAKPVVQPSRVVAKPVAQVRTAVAKPVAQVSKVVARTPLPQVKRAVTQPFKKFDGEDMFENATSGSINCQYVNQVVGYTAMGTPITERRRICTDSTYNINTRFDGENEMSNFSGASDF